MISPRSSNRGVSLIEAIVALALMGFGMLGVVTMQLSLRQNTDISRQRSEALRLAQQPIEDARAYSVTASPPAGSAKKAFDDLAVGATNSTIAGTNATYTRTITLAQTEVQAAQKYKSLSVSVTWQDRTGATQDLTLATAIHRVPPELGVATAVPWNGTVTQTPGGRHPAIPPDAVSSPSEGTSSFMPPNASNTRLIFNNLDARIVRICTIGFSGLTCENFNGRLLSGFVAFAPGTLAPGGTESENPPGPAFTVNIGVSQTAPSGAPSPHCFIESPPATGTVTALAYFCAVGVTTAAPRWSGQSLISGLNLSSSVSDDHDDRFRICRYTPHRTNGTTTIAEPGFPARPITNEEHPFRYVNVESALVAQNFLVIRGGDDDDPFDCPDDLLGTTLINGRTWRHQPSS